MYLLYGIPGGSVVRSLTANVEDSNLIQGWEDPLEANNVNPLQYSCLESPVDREAWWSLAGYSPWGPKESDVTEQLSTQHTAYIWYIDSLAKSGILGWLIFLFLLFHMTTWPLPSTHNPDPHGVHRSSPKRTVWGSSLVTLVASPGVFPRWSLTFHHQGWCLSDVSSSRRGHSKEFWGLTSEKPRIREKAWIVSFPLEFSLLTKASGKDLAFSLNCEEGWKELPCDLPQCLFVSSSVASWLQRMPSSLGSSGASSNGSYPLPLVMWIFGRFRPTALSSGWALLTEFCPRLFVFILLLWRRWRVGVGNIWDLVLLPYLK